MMAKSEKPEIRLGRMELRIMKVVWERGEATVHDVRDALSGGTRKPAYSTVLTMMRKVEAKGYLEHEVDGRTYVYRPTITSQAVRHSMLGDMLERVFEGSPRLLVTSLIEQKRICEKELREIRKLLAKRGEEDG